MINQEIDMIHEHPKKVITKLMRQYYWFKWVTGSGGGISIKQGSTVYIAPSGVSKEMVNEEHIFELDALNGVVKVSPSPELGLRLSQCTPLFMAIYTQRKDARACIHSHSQSAVMASLLWYGKEFRCTHLEMIKGVRNDSTGINHSYLDLLVVPIVENTAQEKDLEDRLTKAMIDYPACSAVLVRRHGFYTWGPSWQAAKNIVEAYDYLFEICVEMKKMNIDPEVTPDCP